MAKRKHASSKGGVNVGHLGDRRSDDMNYKDYHNDYYRSGVRDYEMPNDRRTLMKEDMSKPCGLPMGAHVREVDMSKAAETMSGRPKDLYELVEQTSREDARDIKSLTKPRNF